MLYISRKGFYHWICWYKFYQVTSLDTLDAARLKPSTYIANVVVDGNERYKQLKSSMAVKVLNIFSSETTGPIKIIFHREFLWDGRTKVCSNVPGHMTKMAAMPIYGKNLSGTKKPITMKLNWYAASGAQVLPSLLK